MTDVQDIKKPKARIRIVNPKHAHVGETAVVEETMIAICPPIRMARVTPENCTHGETEYFVQEIDCEIIRP